MHVHTTTGPADYHALFQGPIFRDRYALEWHIAHSHRDAERILLPGMCVPCGRAVTFETDFDLGAVVIEGVRHPNWRERQMCPHCRMSSRQRAAVAFIASVVHANPERPLTIYMCEQVTPLYRTCRELYKHVDIIGSEYLDPLLTSGTVTDGVRHEDVQAMSLADDAVDLFVSNDVLEHVPDVDAALRETARVLAPGGQLFLTVPFDNRLQHNVTRARLIAGDIVHDLEPQYHGNPLSPDGSLVFTDFGWQLLDQARAAGLADVTLKVYWSYLYGHLGIPQFFLHARKPERRA